MFVLVSHSAILDSAKGKINARAEWGYSADTLLYKIRCVSDPVKLKDISHAHT